jgi:hypothetical protein
MTSLTGIPAGTIKVGSDSMISHLQHPPKREQKRENPANIT